MHLTIDNTLEKLLEMARSIEAVELQLSEMKGATSGEDRMNSIGKEVKTKKSQKSVKPGTGGNTFPM